jgi:hypothetical protein
MSRYRMICAAAAGMLLGIPAQVAVAATAVDIASQAGLPAPLPSNGESVVFDQDGDGDLDILLSGHGQEWPLLRQGPAGRFTLALAGIFAARQDRHGCTTADFNGDRLPDVYCVRGACKGICTNNYPKELYLGRSDNNNKIFTKIAGAWGADDPHGRGRGASAFDFDHDGDADLFVANEKSTRYPTIGNHLYRNDGGRFTEVTNTPLRHSIGTTTSTVLPKSSGFPDIALETTDGVYYYRNSNGTFGAGRRVGGSGTFDVDAGDLNDDGLPDLVIVRGPSLEVRLNDGNYSFSRLDYSTSLTQGRDVALCQLDGKTGLDIYVVQGKRPANQDFILLNSSSGKAYQRLATPKANQGHGDVATCVPGIPGGLGAAVLVTNSKWLSAGDQLGPHRLMIVKP